MKILFIIIVFIPVAIYDWIVYGKTLKETYRAAKEFIEEDL